ncbi:UNVERIFIED_CONTAM: hypothetical protein HDU68_010931 [Siphonaria sp. JEL0065]|nr:hypothetical protein HDU68_010931 [Siphonaria sp. JEL0065]
MHKSRKPVTYDIMPTDLPSPLQHSHEASFSDTISSLPSYTRFRSLTDLTFTSKQTFSVKQLPDRLLCADTVQTPQEQLERVRRLTVDDAETVLQVHQLAETTVQGDEYQRRRKGSRRGAGRFGQFSFKFKPRKHFAENPLDILKSTASKIYNKLNFMKPKTDEFTTITPLVVSGPILMRSHSVAGSFVMPPRRLVRQPSISSLNSIATAPEYMYSTSSSASSIIGTRDIPRKPAPQRPASMIAPAAEHLYARDVLGPMPRSAKVLGPRMSECQTLRVSGHVRQTYTRTLQRGNMENRRSLPSKPLPEAPTIEEEGASSTTADQVDEAPDSSPSSSKEPFQQISDVVSLVQEPLAVSESLREVVSYEALIEMHADDNNNCDNLDQQLETEAVACGPGNSSGINELFKAAEEENQNSERCEPAATTSSEQPLSQTSEPKQSATTTEQEIQSVLDTLTDKMNSLGSGFDHAALEKINAAKHAMKEILTHSNKLTVHPVQKEIISPPLISSVVTDQWNKDLIQREITSRTTATTVTAVPLPSEKTTEKFDSEQVESSEQESNTKDSEVLFGPLNNGAFTLDAKVDVIKTVNEVQFGRNVKGEEVAEASAPVTVMPTSTREGKVDMKKNLQDMRDKLNSQHNGINSVSKTTTVNANRWFKKAPPPPPSLPQSGSTSSALGDLSNFAQKAERGRGITCNGKRQIDLGFGSEESENHL